MPYSVRTPLVLLAILGTLQLTAPAEAVEGGSGGTGSFERFLLSEDEIKEATRSTKRDFPQGPLDYVFVVLMVEGGIALNAYLASLDPDIYGGLAVALSPAAPFMCEGCEKPEAIVGGIALGGLGAYNLSLDENRLSSGDIFKRNVVAWHAVGAAIGLTVLANRHRGEKAAGTLRVSPLPGGIQVRYDYRFK